MEKRRQLDLLNYQVNEIDEAGLKPGEEEELEEKRKLFMSSEKICFFITAPKRKARTRKCPGFLCLYAANSFKSTKKPAPCRHGLFENKLS